MSSEAAAATTNRPPITHSKGARSGCIVIPVLASKMENRSTGAAERAGNWQGSSGACCMHISEEHISFCFSIQGYPLPYRTKNCTLHHGCRSSACVRDRKHLHAIIKACARPIFHTLSLDPAKYSNELALFSSWAKAASMNVQSESFGPPRGTVTFSHVVERWLSTLYRPRKKAPEEDQSFG
jgi:hypothetical protein